jgi:hypothetical protein
MAVAWAGSEGEKRFTGQVTLSGLIRYLPAKSPGRPNGSSSTQRNATFCYPKTGQEVAKTNLVDFWNCCKSLE